MIKFILGLTFLISSYCHAGAFSEIDLVAKEFIAKNYYVSSENYPLAISKKNIKGCLLVVVATIPGYDSYIDIPICINKDEGGFTAGHIVEQYTGFIVGALADY